jgi:hypothetical protein
MMFNQYMDHTNTCTNYYSSLARKEEITAQQADTNRFKQKWQDVSGVYSSIGSTNGSNVAGNSSNPTYNNSAAPNGQHPQVAKHSQKLPPHQQHMPHSGHQQMQYQQTQYQQQQQQQHHHVPNLSQQPHNSHQMQQQPMQHNIHYNQNQMGYYNGSATTNSFYENGSNGMNNNQNLDQHKQHSYYDVS